MGSGSDWAEGGQHPSTAALRGWNNRGWRAATLRGGDRRATRRFARTGQKHGRIEAIYGDLRTAPALGGQRFGGFGGKSSTIRLLAEAARALRGTQQ